MPRRSSSQSHRLVDLYKEAEKGQFTPPPATIEPTPEPAPTAAEQSTEEQGFDYDRWVKQCWATRLAIPNGHLRSSQGKKHAEAIFNYLDIQQYDKIGPHRNRGICNPAISPSQRRAYDRRLFLRTLIG